MIRKLLASLTVAALMLFGTAAPVRAAALHGCADNAICLYQWINYGGSKWQSSFYNLDLDDDCINLTAPAAYWASDGAQVWDNSASLVINAGSPTYPSTRYITVYDWANCNNDGSFNSYPVHIDTALPNLNQVYWQGQNTMYHRVTSIGIRSL